MSLITKTKLGLSLARLESRPTCRASAGEQARWSVEALPCGTRAKQGRAVWGHANPLLNFSSRGSVGDLEYFVFISLHM